MSAVKSQIIVQRDEQLLITPGENQLEVANIVRWCAVLEAVVAESLRYRLSPVALWGAAARGVDVDRIITALQAHAAVPLPTVFIARLTEMLSRYGQLKIVGHNGQPSLVGGNQAQDGLHSLHLDWRNGSVCLAPDAIGQLKIEAARLGWPVVDTRTAPVTRRISAQWRAPIELRPYQHQAVEAIERHGSGIVLLPCGAGKTVVGIATLTRVGRQTLILVPSRTVAEQWRSAILDSTTLEAAEVSILRRGQLAAPVSIVTYQAATRGSIGGEIFDQAWGLIIYDEVQSLPAAVFRSSAAVQARHRLGLTATLVREDQREDEVFALVGPVVYDVPWLELEAQGWIAPVRCIEVRVPAPGGERDRSRYRLAVIERLLARHADEPALVIGSRIASLRAAADRFGLPLVTGSTPAAERDARIQAFRDGACGTLAISNVGSVGVDLPNASVMIQISGNFGSRQEEAQRLGRLLRPAPNKEARFYTLVIEGGRDVEYARRRQRFLIDQGYRYEILPAERLPRA